MCVFTKASETCWDEFRDATDRRCFRSEGNCGCRLSMSGRDEDCRDQATYYSISQHGKAGGCFVCCRHYTKLHRVQKRACVTKKAKIKSDKRSCLTTGHVSFGFLSFLLSFLSPEKISRNCGTWPSICIQSGHGFSSGAFRRYPIETKQPT